MNNNYISVSEINTYIKGIVNDDLFLKKVYLKGHSFVFYNKMLEF